MELSFRNALTNDAHRLTEIAFAAKRSWNYPEEYLTIWQEELTITKKYIKDNIVFVAEESGELAGFVSIVHWEADRQVGKIHVLAGHWMDHLFIDPKFQFKGIGSKLVEFTKAYCHREGINSLKIFVDPNATGFYEKVGARFLEYSPSSIEGRSIPIYILAL